MCNPDPHPDLHPPMVTMKQVRVPGQIQEGVCGLLVVADALQTQTVGVERSSSDSGFDDEGQGHPDPRGDQGGHQEVGDRDAPQLPQGARVQAGCAGHQAADHQGQDDHLQHPEQHLSREGEVGHLGSAQVHAPDHHPEPDAHQHPGHREDHEQVPPQELPQLLRAAPPRAAALLGGGGGQDPVRGGRTRHGVPVDLALSLHLLVLWGSRDRSGAHSAE